MHTLERMHRFGGDRELTFESQRISPVDTIPTMCRDFLTVDDLSLGSHVGAEMIRALFFANQTY